MSFHPLDEFKSSKQLLRTMDYMILSVANSPRLRYSDMNYYKPCGIFKDFPSENNNLLKLMPYHLFDHQILRYIISELGYRKMVVKVI